jgi:hypothetical protein
MIAMETPFRPWILSAFCGIKRLIRYGKAKKSQVSKYLTAKPGVKKAVGGGVEPPRGR